MSKFEDKNQDTLKRLGDYIDNNKSNIVALIVAPEMIHHLCEYDKSDTMMMMMGYKYNGVRLIVDYYSPVKAIRVLHKDNVRFDFNVPCMCDTYPDEEHNHELK